MTYDVMLSRLAARCSTTELCTADIRQKLDATDLTPDEKERLLSRLVDEGFVDDNRYARAYVRDKFRFSRWGRVKIAQGLRAKQITSSAIDEALTEIDDDDYLQALRDALRAKRSSLHDTLPYETNAKLLRFALGRGYEMPVILQELKISDADNHI